MMPAVIFGTILLAAEKRYGVTPMQMLGGRRYEPLASVRYMAMVLCKENSNADSEEVGVYFGRDRGICNRAIRVCRTRCETEPAFKEDMNKFRADVGAALEAVK